jgi:hypothetical protein
MTRMKEQLIQTTERLMKQNHEKYSPANWMHYSKLATDTLIVKEAREAGKQVEYCHECEAERPVKVKDDQKYCEQCGWEI